MIIPNSKNKGGNDTRTKRCAASVFVVYHSLPQAQSCQGLENAALREVYKLCRNHLRTMTVLAQKQPRIPQPASRNRRIRLAPWLCAFRAWNQTLLSGRHLASQRPDIGA